MVSSVSSLPQTSSAVNIQIIEPKNFAGGGSTPGAINTGNGQPVVNAGGGPQQQLQDAYQQAVNARNAAEEARTSYLNLANQLNGQAVDAHQPQQVPQYPNGFTPANAAQPVPFQQQQGFAPQGFPQQQPDVFQPQQQPQPWQPQQQQQPAQDPAAQQAAEQQQAAQQAAEQQAAEQAAQQQQQQQPQGLSAAPIEQLNQMIAAPQTLQEKVDAMEEVGVRGQGTPETYDLLKKEALADTSQLNGQAKDDANYIRQASLWTLGMLNKSQNSQVPTGNLPGIDVIQQVLTNKAENPDVKAAAVQALQVMDRAGDPAVAKVLKKASKDKNPDVARLAKEALSGQGIPLPGAGGGEQAPGQAPGGAPGGDPMAGLDPAMLQAILGGGAPGGEQPQAAPKFASYLA